MNCYQLHWKAQHFIDLSSKLKYLLSFQGNLSQMLKNLVTNVSKGPISRASLLPSPPHESHKLISWITSFKFLIKSFGNYVCSHPDCNNVSVPKFCTCHDSSAVVPCAKFWSNLMAITWIILKCNFHLIWNVHEKNHLHNWFHSHQVKCIKQLMSISSAHALTDNTSVLIAHNFWLSTIGTQFAS